MEIKIEKLEQLKLEADKIFLSAEGEKVLVELLDIQKQVEEAIDAAKAKLEETALKLNPTFKSIQADKIKVYYRSFGSQYKIDESLITDLPREFYEVKQSYSPITETIEKFVQEKGGLPLGIYEPDRPKKITFSLKKNGTDTE